MTSFDAGRSVAVLLTMLLPMLGDADAAQADAAPFDLPGPTLIANVERDQSSLPVDEVPTLATGDNPNISTAFTDWSAG